MIDFSGYSDTTIIHTGNNSRVLCAVNDRTGQRVALKTPAPMLPSGSELASISKQYALLSGMDIPGVPRSVGFVDAGQTMALAMEYFDFPSLKKGAAARRLTVAETVTAFARLAAIIAQVHRHGIIHRDITPANVLFDRVSGQVALVDFGSALNSPQDAPAAAGPMTVEGSPHYMSPEQTGRINRPIDHRTDIYSLGATMYEMLTGAPPFPGEDLGEIIHGHIAVEPVAPNVHDRAIPKPLAAIVMRCLAKAPADRYQSAPGLAADLALCLTQLEERGEIAPFTIGQEDFSESFLFPRRLFGREKEFDSLRILYDQAAAGRTGMVMVSGHSGVGKTSLVQELNRTIASDYGHIIYGKYDQYSRTTPYSGLVQAFTFLIRRILTESDANISRWRDHILESVGDNGAVITGMIPELTLLLGEQPPAQPLPPADARTRMATVFSSFIQACSSRRHPLVIFLDDLQWIDSSSLSLMELFGTMDSQNAVLFVGAYRDNEVPASHPLATSLAAMRTKDVQIAELTLAPLEKHAVAEFLAETLRRPVDDVEDVAATLHDKTGGNPLFFKTLLTTLHEQGQISFNHDSLVWQWDEEGIQAAPYADNVVDALRSRILTLPEQSVEVLKLGACTGHAFTLDLLASLSGMSRKELATCLRPALAQRLITTTADDFELYTQDQADGLPDLHCRFLHDRIQQAAYDLLEEQRRPALHLKAGRMLMSLPRAARPQSYLFDIAAHMRHGAVLMEDTQEREEVAGLLLMAGMKAKDSTAFGDAAELLELGLALLPENSWLSRPRLAMDLHFEYAEALSLSARYEDAEAIYLVLEKYISRDEDRLRLCNIKVKQYHYQARFVEAVDMEFTALALMGIDIPREDDDLMPFFGAETERISELLDGRNPGSLYDNTENTDELFTRKLEVLFDLFADSYLIGRGLLCGATSALMARLSMEQGNNAMASVSYINYASTVCAMGADYPTGHAFGSLAVRLAEKYAVPAWQNYAYHVFALAVNHWQSPLETSHAYWTEASKLALASGSPYAGYVFLQLSHVLLASGANLSEVEQQIERSRDFLTKSGLDAIITLLQLIVIQPVRNLRGQTKSLDTLSDDQFDTTAMLESFAELPFFAGSLNYSMLRTACLSGTIVDLDTLKQWIEMIDNTQQGQIMLVDSYLFYLLLLIEGRNDAPAAERKEYQEHIESGLTKMQNWADLCEVNFGHKAALALAENSAQDANLDEIMAMYDDAISWALNQSFVQDAALAAEKAGRFWIRRKRPYIAKSYIEQACIYYSRWGAVAKVDQLREEFAQYLSQHGTADLSSSFRETMTMNPFITGSWSFSEGLDLSSVIKATQAVSRNIVMDDLGRDLVSIAIENAGATKGMLITEREGDYYLTTSMESAEGKGAIDASNGNGPVRYQDSQDLPRAVINYVLRSGKPVVLDNAVIDEQFAGSRYIREHKPASICCMPISRQDNITALLYLENSFTPGVFRADRLQTLEVLAAQATISFENARVYQELYDLNRNLEDMVQQRTRKLHEMNEELGVKNLELERLSTTDQLTGIYNRRRLEEELTKEVGLCQRYNKNVAVIIFDVDKFKRINDEFGHNVGDDVLVKIADVVRSTVRKTDTVGRWGGEEFLVVVPEFAKSAGQVAEKLREALEAVDHPQVGTVTASMGVALYREGDTLSSLINRADTALYEAKETGRNRVVLAE